MRKQWTKREFISVLRKHGYVVVRSHGSHTILKSGNGKQTITVNKDLNRMVARRLLKEAGIFEDEVF